MGGIKIGNGFWIRSDGTLNVRIGAGTQLDDESRIAVKVGNEINIDSNGAVSANIASSSQLGSVKVSGFLKIDSNGTLTSPSLSGYNSLLVSYLFDENRFQLQISIPQLISDGLLHDAENDRIKLKPATTTTLGGIIVGDNLSVDENGKLNASATLQARFILIPAKT